MNETKIACDDSTAREIQYSVLNSGVSTLHLTMLILCFENKMLSIH